MQDIAPPINFSEVDQVTTIKLIGSVRNNQISNLQHFGIVCFVFIYFNTSVGIYIGSVTLTIFTLFWLKHDLFGTHYIIVHYNTVFHAVLRSRTLINFEHVNDTPYLVFDELLAIHRNGNVILMQFSSLATPDVAILTTFRAANDKKMVKMTFSLQCKVYIVCILQKPEHIISAHLVRNVGHSKVRFQLEGIRRNTGCPGPSTGLEECNDISSVGGVGLLLSSANTKNEGRMKFHLTCHGNLFHITDLLLGEPTGKRWIPLKKGQ